MIGIKFVEVDGLQRISICINLKKTGLMEKRNTWRSIYEERADIMEAFALKVKFLSVFFWLR